MACARTRAKVSPTPDPTATTTARAETATHPLLSSAWRWCLRGGVCVREALAFPRAGRKARRPNAHDDGKGHEKRRREQCDEGARTSARCWGRVGFGDSAATRASAVYNNEPAHLHRRSWRPSVPQSMGTCTCCRPTLTSVVVRPHQSVSPSPRSMAHGQPLAPPLKKLQEPE